MRKMALDIGDVRIGIATSDPMGIIAEDMKLLSEQKTLIKIWNICPYL